MAKQPKPPDKEAQPEEETTLGFIPGIPDTPENIARAIVQGPPKKDWRYLKGKRTRPPTQPQEEE